GTENIVRIQLPAKLDRAIPERIQLIYETPKRAWRAAGNNVISAPRIAANIPILKTNWHVFVPEGFACDQFATNLQQRAVTSEPVLLAKPFLWWKKWRETRAAKSPLEIKA